MDIFKSWLVEEYIAHRGLHNEKAPENSMLAFENAIKEGYPIEIDIHQISDGTLIVFHDNTLQRMTGKDGYVKNLKKEDLKKLFLNGTKQTIPTFEEFLSFINGRTPVLIEIKNTGKVGELESALYSQLKKYKGEYAIQSFNPYVLEWFKNNAPEVIRGQLAGFFKDIDLGFFKKCFLKRMTLNTSLRLVYYWWTLLVFASLRSSLSPL